MPRIDWLLSQLFNLSVGDFCLKFAHYEESVGYLEHILKKNCTVNERIALYGGGIQGEKVFNAIWHQEKFKLVGWFDKNYDKLGFLIQSLDAIQNTSFDHLLICIENKYIAEDVREQLSMRGVEDEKLLWYPLR